MGHIFGIDFWLSVKFHKHFFLFLIISNSQPCPSTYRSTMKEWRKIITHTLRFKVIFLSKFCLGRRREAHQPCTVGASFPPLSPVSVNREISVPQPLMMLVSRMSWLHIATPNHFISSPCLVSPWPWDKQSQLYQKP